MYTFDHSIEKLGQLFFHVLNIIQVSVVELENLASFNNFHKVI